MYSDLRHIFNTIMTTAAALTKSVSQICSGIVYYILCDDTEYISCVRETLDVHTVTFQTITASGSKNTLL